MMQPDGCITYKYLGWLKIYIVIFSATENSNRGEYQMNNAIRWHSQTELARLLGMSVNTFKAHYIEKYPPDRVSGRRKYWSHQYVMQITQDIVGGLPNSPQCLPTTA